MSVKELDRLDVVRRLLRKEINGTYAAQLLKVSIRHVRRLKKAVRMRGTKGLVHGNRGKKSNHRIAEKERAQIQEIVTNLYQDFTPTFAAEKLSKEHHINYDRKTIEAIMVSAGVWRKKKHRVKEVHREWRVRRAAFGELIQFDGSYHHWLEDRGGTAEMCLLAAIDDATGKITKAEFAPHEGVFPVFAFWQDYLIQLGKPRAVYLDKFSTYKMNSAVAKDNPDLKTQFQRAMDDLHIEPIFANSPQAKGRVERLFKTLQDRLVKEMRLRNISTVDGANKYITDGFLEDFNRRFAVEPISITNLHTALTAKEKNQLPIIFARQETRIVHNDYTIAFNKNWYQILQSQSVTICRGDRVTIGERQDGSIHLRLRGKDLAYKLLPERPGKTTQAKQPWVLTKNKVPNKPRADHPWRRSIKLESNRTANFIN